MKTRITALLLALIMAFSFAACGTDYKQLGYDQMQKQMDETAAEKPDEVEAVKRLILLWAAFSSYDDIVAQFDSMVDEMTRDNFKDVLDGKEVSDENFELMKEGAKQFWRDYITSYMTSSSPSPSPNS